MALLEWKKRLKISKTTLGMTIQFESDVSIHKEAQNQKELLTLLVLSVNEKTKFQKKVFKNASSRHAKFMKFCRNVDINVENES